jgi:hypothetical protein
VGEVFVGYFVTEDDLLTVFDGGFELGGCGVGLDEEETILEIFVTHVTCEVDIIT